ncbi:hypothetical protein PINS_up008983 [Pythium insidiosum]|nr:hypothetical protein PINS_up008983 [Pythium insidiosum]
MAKVNAPLLFVADDKFSDVIEELTRRGWRRFPHLSFPKFDLKWSNYSKIAWRRVAPTQLVNHLEHATLLSRKDALAQRLYRLPASSMVDGFFLKTFDLSEPYDRQRLRVHFLYAKAVGVLKSALATEAVPSSGTSACPSCAALITSAATALESVISAGDVLEGWNKASVTDLEARRLCDASCRAPSGERERLQRILDALKRWDAQLEVVHAGHGDVWICKPSNLSQGRGIHLLTSLEDILALSERDESGSESSGTTSTSKREQDATATRWVVQKYLERPLLLPGAAQPQV